MEEHEKKEPLTDWIDRYLWQGGKYSEIEIKVKEKAKELHHGGYKFPGKLFNRNGNFQHRSFLGHIAHLVIDNDLLIEIEGNQIDSSIEKLLPDEKTKMNDYFNNLCESSDPYIMIKPIKEEHHLDKEGELHSSIANDGSFGKEDQSVSVSKC